MGHHINKCLSSELHQLIKVLFPTDHQQSAPGETNPTNHIKNNPCGFSCGLIYLLNTLKYDCSNTTVDGKCYSLAVPNLSYYMSDIILSKSNIQITFLYLAHSIKNTTFSLYLSGIRVLFTISKNICMRPHTHTEILRRQTSKN